MSESSVLVEKTGPVAHVTLNRPEVHNAFDDTLIRNLASTFSTLATDDTVRVVVLSGAGRSFCAGADLNWMRRTIDFDQARNAHDSQELAGLFEIIDTCPKAVIGRVQGAAIGGGCGLVAVCDVVAASPRARFGLSEVRLGLAPAVISPYVVRKIGSSRARELFLTGDRIDANRAYDYGLVHWVCETELALDDRVIELTESLLKGGPKAIAACKELAREADQPAWATETGRAAQLIATLRTSPEGQEGMRAFLEKRPPMWLQEPDGETSIDVGEDSE
jgi:methylglutaconyl-CoA hydratase